MSGAQEVEKMETGISANGRVDRSVMRRRKRNAMSRYDWPEDRMDFLRWRRANGPCQNRYWFFDEMRGKLTIELRKGDRVMCYDLTDTELKIAPLGWRWVVAQAVRQVRHALTHNA